MSDYLQVGSRNGTLSQRLLSIYHLTPSPAASKTAIGLLAVMIADVQVEFCPTHL